MIKRNKYLFILLSIALYSCGDDNATGEAGEIIEIKEERLGYLGEHEYMTKTVDGEKVTDTIFHTIEPFVYLNQDSTIVKSIQFEEKIIISDFFFTHCPSICPPMTTQMIRLNKNLEDLSEYIQFLSFSIDPKRDFPTRLREYISEREITAENWQFLTGDEEETHRLGVHSFLVHANSDKEAPGGFAHSDGFTLVDRKGRVRGVYHGTEPVDVDKLEADIRYLLEHEYGIKSKK